VSKHRLVALLAASSLCGWLACARASSLAPTASPVAVKTGPTAAPTHAILPPAATSVPVAREVVRVGHTHGLAGPLQIAMVRGYFEEQGVDLRREEFGSTADAILPLSTGALDVGSTTPNASFFNALARGVRIYLALAGSHVEPGTGGFPLVVRRGPDGPVVASVADLRGKRVGQNQRGAINEWALERMLAGESLRLEDVEVVIMPFPDVLAGFGGGSVDAAILPDPLGTIAEERGLATRLLDADEYVAGAQVAAMSFSEQFARHEATARRWAVAYLCGVRDYMDAMEFGRDREAILAILGQASGFDPRLLQRAGYFPMRRDGRVNGEAIQSMLDWLVQRGYVPHKPDIAPLLDHRYADYAAHVLSKTN